MQKEVEAEFSNFLSALTKGIGTMLVQHFPRNAVEQVCVGLSGEFFRNVLDGLVTSWYSIGNRSEINNHYGDAVSILLIQMIGPLNRLPLPDDVESNKLFYAFLSVLDRLLQHVTLRQRFSGILENALKAA